MSGTQDPVPTEALQGRTTRLLSEGRIQDSLITR